MKKLRDCFESTGVFCKSHMVRTRRGSHTAHLTTLTTKTVHCFPNNKTWITSNVKDIINRKKRAFKEGDQAEFKHVHTELKVQLRETKQEYRRKVERKLQNNYVREVWEGMKTITGCGMKNNRAEDGDSARANQLNLFFNRFDNQAPASSPQPQKPLLSNFPSSHLQQLLQQPY